MAKNVQLLGCIKVVMSGNCDNITMINCSGMTGNATMNGRTYNLNGRVLKNGWTTLDSTNADVSQPYTMDGSAGNKYKVDTSGGDIYARFDVEAMEGESVWLKIIDASNNLIITTTDGSGQFEQAAVPVTINPVLLESYTISSDGTDLFII